MRARRSRFWALAATAVVASAALLIPAGAASARSNICHDALGFGAWTSEQDMTDAYGGYCRSTFVNDPGVGNLLSRQGLLAAAPMYGRLGFSRQWLWYAPESTVFVPAHSPLRWQGCLPTSTGNPPGVAQCYSGAFDDHPITDTFGFNPVTLHTFGYDGRFLVRACGNNSVGLSGSDPVPVVTGHKFSDTDRDGVRDAGEPGVGGITFQLIRQASAFGDQGTGLVATTTSDGNGDFGFALNGQGPGGYTVHEVLPAGSVSTTGLEENFTVPAGAGSSTVADLQFGNRPEHPPVADAGPDQQIDQTSDAGASVTLDGTGSYDPDGDPISYTWYGPFGIATGARPTVTMPVGTNTVTLSVSDGMASDTIILAVPVGTPSSVDDAAVTVLPPITATGQRRSGVEGAALRAAVATFTDPDPAGRASQYRADIDWGDGTPATGGTVSKNSDGVFTVAGDHTYAEEGNYTATVTIVDKANAYNTDTVSDPVDIADAPLTATGVDDLSTNPVDGLVATFVDANPGGDLSDFTATIDWNDGSTPTAGTITGTAGGTFSVRGTHSYATLGPKTITVHVLDEGGAQATATSQLLLYAYPAAGNFAIGDLNSAIGTPVTFWGAQWSKVNRLSGGAAPDAFKGYETGTTPSGWITDPGNSAHPVDSVPTYLAVVVTSRVTQSGSTITGNAPHVVIVRTDPGYRGAPGHEGTATVVAALR
jgi:hypothetical protein